jgi:hypothetical protein
VSFNPSGLVDVETGEDEVAGVVAGLGFEGEFAAALVGNTGMLAPD